MIMDREKRLAAHIKARPHLRDIFEFQHRIEEIWNSSSPDDFLPVVCLSEPDVRQRMKEGTPLIDRPLFSKISLTNSESQMRRILTVMKTGGGEREILASKMASYLRGSGRGEAWFIRSILAHDDGFLDRVSQETEVPGPLLLHLLRMSLRISFERLHETLRTVLRNLDWDYPLCPVCGAAPSIGQTISPDERRYFCYFCSFSWLAHPPEGCPSCGLIDPDRVNLLYKHPEENQGILACEGCFSYLKVVDQRYAEEDLDSDFQEILGIHLDLAAMEMGFHPLGQPPGRAEIIVRPGIDSPKF